MDPMEEFHRRRLNCSCFTCVCWNAFWRFTHTCLENAGIHEQVVDNWLDCVFLGCICMFFVVLTICIILVVITQSYLFFSAVGSIFIIGLIAKLIRSYMPPRSLYIKPRLPYEARRVYRALQDELDREIEMAEFNPVVVPVRETVVNETLSTSSLSPPPGVVVGETLTLDADFHKRQSESSAHLSAELGSSRQSPSCPSDSADSAFLPVSPSRESMKDENLTRPSLTDSEPGGASSVTEGAKPRPKIKTKTSKHSSGQISSCSTSRPQSTESMDLPTCSISSESESKDKGEAALGVSVTLSEQTSKDSEAENVESSSCTSSDKASMFCQIGLHYLKPEYHGSLASTSRTPNSANQGSSQDRMPVSAENAPVPPERPENTESGDADDSSSVSSEDGGRQKPQPPTYDGSSGSSYL